MVRSARHPRLFAACVWLALPGIAAAEAPRVQADSAALPPDVLAVIREHYASPELETRTLDGSIDLNDDARPEIIVHVVGAMACGTGGCPTLVFSPHESGYRLVSSIGVSNAPILASTQRTHGWRDLIVQVGGGGMPAAEVELHFDGQGYPENPTVSGPNVTPVGDGSAQLVIPEFESLEAAHPLPAGDASSPSVAPLPVPGAGAAPECAGVVDPALAESCRQRVVEAQIRGGQLEAPKPAGFVCPGHEDQPFTVSFYETEPRSAVITFGNRQTIAFATRSGSGSRYMNPEVDFWEHHGEASVRWSGKDYLCKAR